MPYQTIATQELRTNLPKILQEVARGGHFEIIYRSKPVAELTPPRIFRASAQKSALQFFAHPPKRFLKGRWKSSVALVRAARRR